MLTVDADQLTLAARASTQMVTLVELTTFSDYEAETVDEVFYYATVPVTYKWDGVNDTRFRGPLASVSPIARGFPHIPNAAELSTRDGMRISFDASEWAGEFPWERLTSGNLIGAKVVIASLLVDWPMPLEPTWQDLTSMGDVHVVRFRGECTDVPEYNDEGNVFELVFDSVEPDLNWARARDEQEVSARDLGRTYPVPVGEAPHVPLVQRQVGWVTTLISAITAEHVGVTFVTDTTGFPDAPTQFPLYIGRERLIAEKNDATSIIIVDRARSLGTFVSVAAPHESGVVIIEELTSAKFVYSGTENLGLSNIYARSPQTGELVLLPSTYYGFTPSDKSLDAGEALGVVTFTGQLWAFVIALLNRESEVTQQPIQADAGNFRTESTTRTAAYTSSATATDMIVASGTAEARYSGSVDEAGGFYWLGTDLTSQTDVVVRFRTKFDYRIRSGILGAASTTGSIQYDDGFLGLQIGGHSVSLLAGEAEETGTIETAWTTCPAGTTVADMVNHATAFDSNGPKIKVEVITSGGSPGASNQFEVDTLSVEMELSGSTITRTADVLVGGAQEFGFNLDLFADVRGAVRLGTETSEDEFDSSTGWTGSGVTFSDIGGGGGFNAISNGTLIERTSAYVGFSPAYDLSSSRFKFDYQLDQATFDALELTDRAFQVQLVSSGGDITWAWPRSSLYVGAWTEFTFDPSGSAPQIIEANGTLDLSSVSTMRLVWRTNVATDGGTISYRDVRLEARTYPQHPIDIAEWLIEDSVGITDGADSGTFATAKTNLPSITMAGDLRNAGDSFAAVLARIGYECRTNFVPSETSSQTVYKALNAQSTFDFPAAASEIIEYRELRTRTKSLIEQPTRFVALHDFSNEFLPEEIDGYRALMQANETDNDISSDVPTVDITDAQARIGKRDAEPLAFFLAEGATGTQEAFAYYVQETLRGSAKRYSAKASIAEAYAMEPGDIYSITPRWSASALKVRLIQTIFSSDTPSVGLNLEEVL